MICPKCKKENESGCNFCMYCGDYKSPVLQSKTLKFKKYGTHFIT